MGKRKHNKYTWQEKRVVTEEVVPSISSKHNKNVTRVVRTWKTRKTRKH